MAQREWSIELKKGAIQLCIMSLLKRGRKYGFQIIKEMRDLSDGYFDIKEGTLYPALHRLEKRGLVVSEWVIEGSSPPRRYYKLTAKGEETLINSLKEWRRMVKATDKVIGGGGE